MFNGSGPEHPTITLKLALLWGGGSPERLFIPNYSVIVSVQRDRDRHLRFILQGGSNCDKITTLKKWKHSALDSAQTKHAWTGVEGWRQLCSPWTLHRWTLRVTEREPAQQYWATHWQASGAYLFLSPTRIQSNRRTRLKERQVIKIKEQSWKRNALHTWG